MYGQPLKYSDPEKLQKDIEAYFAKCDARTKTVIAKDGSVTEISWPIPYTVEGLAVALKTNRQTLINYGSREAYFDIIAHAKARIQANKVEGGLDGSYNAQMAKFMMINNYGYSEKLEKEEDNNINVIINVKRKGEKEPEEPADK